MGVVRPIAYSKNVGVVRPIAYSRNVGVGSFVTGDSITHSKLVLLGSD